MSYQKENAMLWYIKTRSRTQGQMGVPLPVGARVMIPHFKRYGPFMDEDEVRDAVRQLLMQREETVVEVQQEADLPYVEQPTTKE